VIFQPARNLYNPGQKATGFFMSLPCRIEDISEIKTFLFDSGYIGY
jgi:hypothetical protein